jgi:phage-related protein
MFHVYLLRDEAGRHYIGMTAEEIVLLHGFIKKTRQTPSEELNLAKNRKLRYLAAYEE